MPGEAEKARFNLPEIQVNQSGWGPSAIETKFKDMPYQPFSKSDRLGKVRFQTHNRVFLQDQDLVILIRMQSFSLCVD